MSKQVTRQRILKALSKVSTFRAESIETDSTIVTTMATLGMKTVVDSTFGQATPAHEFQRANLELNYLGVPKNQAELEKILDRWRYNLSRRHHFIDRIFELQAKHNISGLARTHYSLGDREFECWGESDDLRLIETDLEALRSERSEILECWLDYAVTNGLTFWAWQSKKQGREGYWRKCSISIIETALPFYDWALVYEEKSYTSPSQLKAQGWDICRNTPELSDDELHWEVHLDMGCGTDLNSGDASRIYFCACNEVPRL